MHYIYADEAGISPKEPVTVVVGVIVHADRYWRAANDKLTKVLDEGVPEKLRAGFIFHAKDVWGGYRDFDKLWSREQRADLIAAVASIPRTLGMAVSLGLVRRGSFSPHQIRPADFHHVFAFGICMSRANKYIRDWFDADEVATVVAEDVPDKRKYLKKALQVEDFKVDNLGDYVLPTLREKEVGRLFQTLPGPIDRIIDTVHFAAKDEAPLLQLADACAFSFRRYFAGQRGGDGLVAAMLGASLVWDDWQGPVSEMTVSFNPLHRYPMPV